MQGKLYPESTSIYQDEARILFDYFSKAANEIVQKEDEIKKKIEEAESQRKRACSSKTKALVLLIIYFVLAVAGGIYSYMYLFKSADNSVTMLIEFSALSILLIIFIVRFCIKSKAVTCFTKKCLDARHEFDSIRRDYKVGKMGIAYVPVAKKIPFEDKSITVDLSGSVSEEVFSLNSLSDADAFEQSVSELRETMSKVPIVDTYKEKESLDTADYSPSMQEVPQYDYLGEISSEVSKISKELSSVNEMSVSLQVIEPGSENMDFLDECGTTEPSEYPVINVFDESRLEPKLDLFHKLYSERKKNENTGSEKALENLTSFLGVAGQIITRNKMTCCSAVLAYCDDIFANVLKASSRNYSPRLEADVIKSLRGMNFNFSDMVDTYKPFRLKESSLMKFDLYSNSWVDETGAHLTTPYGLNQIHEEIFMPLISNLMEENSIERRKLYDRIQEQKMDYLNKWHTETQDFYGRNRESSDNIKSNIIQTLSKYNAAYSSWKSIKDTIERMDNNNTLESGRVEKHEGDAAAMVVSAQTYNETFRKTQEDFDSYMERLQDDIESRSDSFGHVTYFEAFLYAEEAQKAAIAIDSLGSFDDRQLHLARISPYIAKYAELPPKPEMESQVFDLASLDLEKLSEEALKKEEEPIQESVENLYSEVSGNVPPEQSDNNLEPLEGSDNSSEEESNQEEDDTNPDSNKSLESFSLIEEESEDGQDKVTEELDEEYIVTDESDDDESEDDDSDDDDSEDDESEDDESEDDESEDDDSEDDDSEDDDSDDKRD